ncbi:MAG: DUF3313 family protein [Gammaproteobacteria bacterium]
MKQLIFTLMLVMSSALCVAQDTKGNEETFDGLVPVKNSAFKRAWAAPDIDLSRYTKVIPLGAEFEYRAVRGGTGTSFSRSNQREFPISDKDKAKLVEVVGEVFDEELQKSTRFEIVQEPGPDVLILLGTLLDIVSLVPPERSGRTEVYLSRVAEATLVLELRDSMSNETLVRAAERRAAERPGGSMNMMWSNPVTNWAEVRRLARSWATKLRKGLDSVEGVPQPSGDAAAP